MKKKTMHKSSSHHQTLAHWLDDRFTIPGTKIKFGLDPIIGLVPGAGDWLSGLLSSYFLLLGVRADVPPSVLTRIGFNILLDTFIGSIPLLGDIFDVGWKANMRNARLLEKYQGDSKKTERHSKWLLWGIAALMILLVIFLLLAIVWLVGKVIGVIF